MLLEAGDLDGVLDDLARTEAVGHERAIFGGEHRAHPVAAVHGLRRRRPDLAEDDERGVRLAALDGRVQQQVSEAEVGEQAPRADKALEMRELWPFEVSAQPRELGQ